jgi:hypothetical protein
MRLGALRVSLQASDSAHEHHAHEDFQQALRERGVLPPKS